MEFKKVNDDVFMLGDRIDILKQNMTDREYMNAMDSLSRIKNRVESIQTFISNVEEFMGIHHSFNYDINSTSLSNYMNSVNEYIYLKTQIRIILTKKLNKFRIERQLPEDFMKSKFNLIDFICNLDFEILKKNYIIENNQIKCQCNNSEKHIFCCNSINDFVHCGHLQDIILQYPLLLITCFDRPIDEIIVEIVKYNMFIFDGSVKDMDNKIITNIELNDNEKEKYVKNVHSLLVLSDNIKLNLDFTKRIRYIKKICIVLSIYKHICYNGLFIKNHTQFYDVCYNKLNYFRNDGMRVFYDCFTKLNLPHNLFDLIDNNLCEYIGYSPELSMQYN